VIQSSRRLILGLLILLTGGQLFLLYIWAIEPNWIEVTRHEVWFERLPRSFDGLTVAHLSDIHIRRYGSREQRTLRLLAEAKPALIVVTGDFTRANTDPDLLRRFNEGLRDLAAPLGVWGVLGNHDHWHSPAPDERAVRLFFADAGLRLLINQGGHLERGVDRLSLLGVDDPFTGLARLETALRDRLENSFTVLLAHSPEIFPRADLAHVDLVLAGHTHGGQLRFPFIGPLWLPRGSEPYESGWFNGRSAKMYVTRGIGTSVLPFRFLCRPELSLITLRSS
jgi:predicted MPP superfamily phosphohydrolase